MKKTAEMNINFLKKEMKKKKEKTFKKKTKRNLKENQKEISHMFLAFENVTAPLIFLIQPIEIMNLQMIQW